jgi:hypothetical protein
MARCPMVLHWCKGSNRQSYTYSKRLLCSDERRVRNSGVSGIYSILYPEHNHYRRMGGWTGVGFECLCVGGEGGGQFNHRSINLAKVCHLLCRLGGCVVWEERRNPESPLLNSGRLVRRIRSRGPPLRGVARRAYGTPSHTPQGRPTRETQVVVTCLSARRNVCRSKIELFIGYCWLVGPG